MTLKFQTLPRPCLAEFYFVGSCSEAAGEVGEVVGCSGAVGYAAARSEDVEASSCDAAPCSDAAASNKITVLSDEALWQACGVRIAFTNREGGVSAPPFNSLNLHHKDGDLLANETINRKLLLSCFKNDIKADKLICPNQVHGDKILEISNLQEAQNFTPCNADGVICNAAGVPVLLCFADCVPVIVVAPNSTFAVLHAGWRGAYADIAAKGLVQVSKLASCSTKDCNVYIGPHIGECCFEVSSEIYEKFVNKYGNFSANKYRYVNLSEVIIRQLARVGASTERIANSKICTSCNVNKYYSYRKESSVTGRHGALAFIRG